MISSSHGGLRHDVVVYGFLYSNNYLKINDDMIQYYSIHSFLMIVMRDCDTVIIVPAMLLTAPSCGYSQHHALSAFRISDVESTCNLMCLLHLSFVGCQIFHIVYDRNDN